MIWEVETGSVYGERDLQLVLNATFRIGSGSFGLLRLRWIFTLWNGIWFLTVWAAANVRVRLVDWFDHVVFYRRAFFSLDSFNVKCVKSYEPTCAFHCVSVSVLSVLLDSGDEIWWIWHRIRLLFFLRVFMDRSSTLMLVKHCSGDYSPGIIELYSCLTSSS